MSEAAQQQRDNWKLISELRNNHAYEEFIGRLYELLTAERFDDALDFVCDEYRAIHGPAD